MQGKIEMHSKFYMQETWKPLKFDMFDEYVKDADDGTDSYEISNLGNTRHSDTKKQTYFINVPTRDKYGNKCWSMRIQAYGNPYFCPFSQKARIPARKIKISIKAKSTYC